MLLVLHCCRPRLARAASPRALHRLSQFSRARCRASAGGRRPNTTPPVLCRHALSTAARDSVAVACRSNGEVHLSILRPQRDQQRSPILLYLPPGPLLPETPPEHNDDILAALSAASSATVVSVDYRLDDQHRFPTPVHDLLAAYDWVLENLASQPQHRSPHRPHVARMGVCGELIGGSLATMLALTECQMGAPRIAAAAVNNPIVDWIFPSDLRPEGESENAAAAESSDADYDIATAYIDSKGRITRKKDLKKDRAAQLSSWDRCGGNPALPASALGRARKSLFPNTDAYFDRFASPIHFFRTPGIGYVTPTKSEDDLASQAYDDFEMSPTLESVLEKRRRSHRMHPPTGMGLRLPVLSVSVGEDCLLRDQGEELVRLVQRSVIRDSRSSEEADRRCGLTLRPGLGLWSGPSRSPDWRQEVEELGKWFARVLA